MMLRFQKYDSTVRRKTGRKIAVADTLSNVHLRETDHTHDAFYAQVRLVVANLQVYDQKISDLKASIYHLTLTCNGSLQSSKRGDQTTEGGAQNWKALLELQR